MTKDSPRVDSKILLLKDSVEDLKGNVSSSFFRGFECPKYLKSPTIKTQLTVKYKPFEQITYFVQL
jgi:hypothetical protein